jgi:hypothetical protein
MAKPFFLAILYNVQLADTKIDSKRKKDDTCEMFFSQIPK